jgi:HK97 family phage portal protein
VIVNEHTALNLSAVWAAVTVISGTVASLPLLLYKRLPNGGKERFVDHPVYRMLHDEPNPEMTSMVFRETLQAHVLLWGNAYAEIQRDQAGRPVALWPLSPQQVEPFRDKETRVLRYRVTNETGRQVIVDAERILHVPGLGFDGIVGYSVVRKARESLGLALATETFGATFFGNGAWPGLVAQHPGKLSDPAAKRLKDSLNEALQGPTRAHNLIVTEEGIKVEKMGIPPDDAQFLETRKFQIVEIARWFNLPPHKLRDLERATFSNIEHQGIDFVVDLRLWFVRWEQELNRKLIRPLERKIQFVEHLVDGLLRGDSASRVAIYASGRQWGWLSADDIRERENLNPLPDGQGQIYLIPQNMIPADQADALIDADPPPPPALEPAPVDDDDDDDDRTLAALGELREQIDRLALPAPIPDPPQKDAELAARLGQRIEESEQRIRERIDAAGKPAGELAERLATDRQLREWQQAIIATIAGRLVRRELKAVGNPKRPAERLAAFYARFAADGVSELRPWLLRVSPDPALAARVEALLSAWAVDARRECEEALRAGSLDVIHRRWEVDREESLTTVLMEAIHG